MNDYLAQFKALPETRTNGQSARLVIAGTSFPISLWGTGEAVARQGSGDPVEALLRLTQAYGDAVGLLDDTPLMRAAFGALAAATSKGEVPWTRVLEALAGHFDDDAPVMDMVVGAVSEVTRSLLPSLIRRFVVDEAVTDDMYTVLHWLLIDAMPELSRADLEEVVPPHMLPVLLYRSVSVWTDSEGRSAAPAKVTADEKTETVGGN